MAAFGLSDDGGVGAAFTEYTVVSLEGVGDRLEMLPGGTARQTEILRITLSLLRQDLPMDHALLQRLSMALQN